MGDGTREDVLRIGGLFLRPFAYSQRRAVLSPEPPPFPADSITSGKKRHYAGHAAPTNRRIMLDGRRPTANK